MSYTDFDKRMKENYEFRSRTYLTRRTPVIVRVDGKAFHTFCKRFEKPYDEFLNESLNGVMQFLCQNVQGVKFAERHSDEISLLLTDFDSLQTDAYFDYNVQKIVSVVASMATAEFCRILASYESTSFLNKVSSCLAVADGIQDYSRSKKVLNFSEDWPCFDARCFNIPESEVNNYFWWRMRDAVRGSINMTGQFHFPHKELQGLSCDDIQEKLFQEKGINWDTLPQGQKTGFTCKKYYVDQMSDGVVICTKWQVEGGPKTKSELDDMMSSIEFVKPTNDE